MSKAETRLSLIGIIPGAVIGYIVKRHKHSSSNKAVYVGIMIGFSVGFLSGMALDKMLSKLQ